MKTKVFFPVALALLCICPIASAQTQEKLQLTTYYPAPYGEYDELRATKMGIGGTYASPTQPITAPNVLMVDGNVGIGTTTSPANLIVEGNVGIGTASPGKELDVAGDLRLRGDLATINFYRTTGPTDIAYLKYNNTNSQLDMAANNKNIRFVNRLGWLESMRITPAGNVGIGTVNPASSLDVAGGVRAAIGVPGNANPNVGYSFNLDGDTGMFRTTIGALPASGGDIVFKTDNAEKVRIKNTTGELQVVEGAVITGLLNNGGTILRARIYGAIGGFLPPPTPPLNEIVLYKDNWAAMLFPWGTAIPGGERVCIGGTVITDLHVSGKIKTGPGTLPALRTLDIGRSTIGHDGMHLDPCAKSAVVSPQYGDIIIDSADNNNLKFYNGTEWRKVSSVPG